MKQNLFSAVLGVVTAVVPFLTGSVLAQTLSSDGVPVSIVVTVNPHHDAEVSSLSANSVAVYQDHAWTKVTDFVPLHEGRAGVELFILLDASRNLSVGSQLADIRRFIMAQPAATKIGVAYMQLGGPKIVQPLGIDHQLAAEAVNPSLSNLANTANPYESLSQVIDKWPDAGQPREILMVSGGVDEIFEENGVGKSDIYLDAAIEKAQRAGVIVSTIATTGPNVGQTYADQGKNYLAELASETGGEFYFYRSSAPTSFAAYLDDLTTRLSRQYRMTFLAQPGKKSGMQSIKVRSGIPHVQVLSAEKVYVPAS